MLRQQEFLTQANILTHHLLPYTLKAWCNNHLPSGLLKFNCLVLFCK